MCIPQLFKTFLYLQLLAPCDKLHVPETFRISRAATVDRRTPAPRGAGRAQGKTYRTCDKGGDIAPPDTFRGEHTWVWATGATGSHCRRLLNLTFKPFTSEKIHS